MKVIKFLLSVILLVALIPCAILALPAFLITLSLNAMNSVKENSPMDLHETEI